MKLLILSEFFPTGKDLKFSGGVEARNYYIAKNLTKKNNVIVITSKINGTTKTENLNSFKVVRVGPERDYKASTGDLVKRLIFIKDAIKIGREQNPDIVEGTNFITHFICKLISLNLKIPSVYWYPDVWIGSWIKNAGPPGIFGEILERINLFLKADAYIAISKSTAKKLESKIKQKVIVIPCGVDLKEFKRKEKKYEKITILTISRLTKYKNIKDLLLAFALLKKKFKNLQLVVVGRGPQESSLKKLTKELKLKDVSFQQNLPRKKLDSLIKKSHIFCLPSSVEGFGISVIEAAASGTPFVVSDIEVFDEITQKGKGGLIFRTRDIYDLSGKIENLITDEQLYKRKSKEGQALSRKYDWIKISEETQKVHESLLAGK